MHSFTTKSTTFVFNSDLSGDVEIYRDTVVIKVPGDELLDFVAEYVRAKRIGQLELMKTREILGIGAEP